VSEIGSITWLDGLDDGQGTCVLELAASGERTLEEVGALDGITRERVRQIEIRALHQGRAAPAISED
jgi:DNA-directed RNA polymerase sigma subunit (sigma70/sigma32)